MAAGQLNKSLSLRMMVCGLALFAYAAGEAHAQSYDYVPGGTYHSLTPVTEPVADDENSGVQLGDLVLHPGIALEGGYDSNVFFEEESEGIENAPVFHVMPSLRLETPDPRALRLTSHFQALIELFASDNELVTSQNGVDLLLDLAAQLGGRGFLSITAYDVGRSYTDTPSSPGSETRGHFYNEAGGMLAFHPGGSDRTSRLGFTAALTGGYGIERWDADLNLDRDLILGRLEVKYFFLPKTAFHVRGAVSSVDYAVRERGFDLGEDPFGLEPAFAGSLVNVDSAPVRIMGGVSGLLTRQIDFGLEGGYGWANYSEDPDFDGWLAGVRFGVFFMPSAHLTVSWDRGFADSSFANFYEYDRFAAALDLHVGNWLIGGSGGVENQRFATIDVPVATIGTQQVALFNTGEREDPVVTTELFVAWSFTPWSRVTAYYDVRANLTDFVVTTGQASGPDRPSSSAAQYTKHQVFLALEFEY